MIPKNLFLAAVLTIVCIISMGCSTLAKPSAGAAIPFAAVADTAVMPVQLIGDAGKGLIYLGDRHQTQVYDANKDSVTLPLDELTTMVFYIPGYLLLPFDSITPDEYYSLTKSCLNVINARPEREKVIRKYKPAKMSKDDFDDF